jgi:hypothetical protein
MFVDPLGTVSVSLPPSWAFDPRISSLTRLAFADWTSPSTRRVFVLVSPDLSMVAPGKTDGDWEMAVRARLPAEVTRIERRPGPVVFVELPGAEARPDSRFAWARGPRLDVLIEQQGVPLGGALATPELAEALRTLNVPINYRIVDRRPQAEWNAAMDAAAHARATGDNAAATGHLLQAREIAGNTWLHSLIRSPNPDILAAAAEAEATLALAVIARSVDCLCQATTTLYRCRFSRVSSHLPKTAIDEYIDKLVDEALKLHGEFDKGTPPIDPIQASQVRARLFLQELVVLEELADSSNAPKSDRPPWMMLGKVAALASEDAMTAVALVPLGATLHYSNISSKTKATLLAVGVSDDASLQKRVKEEEIQSLEILALAGQGLSQVQLGAISVGARATRANALLAARRLVELAPSPERYRTLVNVMNGYAGSLVELGDQPSLDEAQSVLAEAQAVLDRLGDEIKLRAQICANEAWLRCERKNTDAGLAVVDRAITLAHAARMQRTEELARSCRSRLLNLAGRHDEALEEARRAIPIMQGGAGSTAHESLAIAYYHTGHLTAALDEIRAGLAVAFTCNPLGDDVESLLSTVALIQEQHDPAASFTATDTAEVLFDLRRRDIGSVADRVAYDDAARHRQLAATLVKRLLDAHDVLGALATADRHRARSLAEAAGLQGSPGNGVSYTLPPADASLAEQIAFVAATARKLMKRWGIPLPLDGPALSTIVASHGRTVVLFHPNGTQLLAFVVRPGASLVVDSVIATVSVPEVIGLTDALRQQLGIVVAGRAARGHLPHQSIDELEAAFIAADEGGDQADVQLDRLRRKLHDALLSEVLPLLHDREPVVVVPYRELSVIPLAVLTGADGQALVDRHPLSVLPSLASLSALASPGVGPPSGIVVGDPLLPSNFGLAQLPGAADEAEHVRQMLERAGVDTTPLLGPDATEENFRTSVTGARVVHLACHAALREPASASRLFLTPSQHDDGLLLPAEIADLRLDGALVVLSACQSGLGRATADGVLGLGRAFMQAGARTLVLSLWRVGDAATASLMREFYDGLLGAASDVDGRRLDVAAAARRAQLVTRNGLSNHPSVWGPWLVVGDGGWRLG